MSINTNIKAKEREKKYEKKNFNNRNYGRNVS